jgi:hypothetical protein
MKKEERSKSSGPPRKTGPTGEFETDQILDGKAHGLKTVLHCWRGQPRHYKARGALGDFAGGFFEEFVD